jgi:hypothetical protein
VRQQDLHQAPAHASRGINHGLAAALHGDGNKATAINDSRAIAGRGVVVSEDNTAMATNTNGSSAEATGGGVAVRCHGSTCRVMR